jgi:hypothetical protein
MKKVKLLEEFMNEAKSFQFTFDYNTDPDDIEYIENLLKRAKVNAYAEQGTFDDEMVVIAGDAIELRKAKKAIQADGFEINESVVNEGDMTKFYDGFIVLDSKTKKTYKFKYVKGTKNTEVESNAIAKLASSTKSPSSNFMVHGFVQKGEWNNIKKDTIDEAAGQNEYNEGDLVKFKDDKEVWQVVKAGMRNANDKVQSKKVVDTKSYIKI